MNEDNIHLIDWFSRAIELHKNGNINEARILYEKILRINPQHYQSLSNLGVIAKNTNHIDIAEKFFLKAIKVKPDYVDGIYNLAVIKQEKQSLTEARFFYQMLISIKPDSYVAHYNLGNMLKDWRHYDEAREHYIKAIEINPEYIDANFNLGMLLLLMSNLKAGFDYYEWRKELPTFKKINHKNQSDSKEWNNQNLNGKTILIVSEQGYGDTVQFARYVYLLQQKFSVKIIFQTHQKLIHFFSKSSFEVISMASPLPIYDYYVYLMSLPRLFLNCGSAIERQINYISVNHGVLKKWEHKLSNLSGLKVGINWKGNSEKSAVPLNAFNSLFDLRKVDFISLQRGLGTEQINHFYNKKRLFTDLSKIDMDKEENAFEESIGMISNLDLVITIDTALAHVSSTLGVETWVLLSATNDWRWFLNSSRTPWYQATRLYRQQEPYQWNSVFEKIKTDLKNKSHKTV